MKKGKRKRTKDRRLLTKIVVAGVNALLLSLLVFAGDRLDYSLGGEGSIMKKIETLRGLTATERSEAADDFVAVNVGYDREFVPALDCFDMPVGRRSVVDRGKLAQFLDSIDGASYRSLVVDVQFFESDSTEADESLFAALRRLPRLVLAENADYDAVKCLPDSLFAFSEYGTTLDENNFVKYIYAGGSRPSIARRVYQIETSDRSTGASALYLPLPYSIGEGYDEEFNKTVYHLGADILDVYTREELAALVAGRTVVVGDYYVTDTHDSYAGEISGPEITINAVIALRQGKDRINWWVAAMMFIVYFCVSMAAMVDVAAHMPFGLGRRRVWRFAMSFVSFSLVILSMTVGIYLLTGVFHDVFFTTLWMTIFYFIYPKIRNKYPDRL